MGFVDGVVLDSVERAEPVDPEIRRLASEHLVDVLADLHAIDVDAVGLGDLARRDGYVERQIKRWSTQWANSRTRELPAIDEVATRLAADIPVQRHVVVAHGDFRFGNCLTDIEKGRINAVLDWELCTLGDPMADVGYLMNDWNGPDDSQLSASGTSLSATTAGGFPDRAAILARYEELTGASTQNVDYYRAFQYWRLAAIVEGVLSRYKQGVMGDAVDVSVFEKQVDSLAGAALELARSEQFG
jgi:aminoglycoside phosphotransferase (APT) family kinase protein